MAEGERVCECKEDLAKSDGGGIARDQACDGADRIVTGIEARSRCIGGDDEERPEGREDVEVVLREVYLREFDEETNRVCGIALHFGFVIGERAEEEFKQRLCVRCDCTLHSEDDLREGTNSG